MTRLRGTRWKRVWTRGRAPSSLRTTPGRTKSSIQGTCQWRRRTSFCSTTSYPLLKRI